MAALVCASRVYAQDDDHARSPRSAGVYATDITEPVAFNRSLYAVAKPGARTG